MVNRLSVSLSTPGWRSFAMMSVLVIATFPAPLVAECPQIEGHDLSCQERFDKMVACIEVGKIEAALNLGFSPNSDCVTTMAANDGKNADELGKAIAHLLAPGREGEEVDKYLTGKQVANHRTALLLVDHFYSLLRQGNHKNDSKDLAEAIVKNLVSTQDSFVESLPWVSFEDPETDETQVEAPDSAPFQALIELRTLIRHQSHHLEAQWLAERISSLREDLAPITQGLDEETKRVDAAFSKLISLRRITFFLVAILVLLVVAFLWMWRRDSRFKDALTRLEEAQAALRTSTLLNVSKEEPADTSDDKTPESEPKSEQTPESQLQKESIEPEQSPTKNQDIVDSKPKASGEESDIRAGTVVSKQEPQGAASPARPQQHQTLFHGNPPQNRRQGKRQPTEQDFEKVAGKMAESMLAESLDRERVLLRDGWIIFQDNAQRLHGVEIRDWIQGLQDKNFKIFRAIVEHLPPVMPSTGKAKEVLSRMRRQMEGMLRLQRIPKKIRQDAGDGQPEKRLQEYRELTQFLVILESTELGEQILLFKPHDWLRQDFLPVAEEVLKGAATNQNSAALSNARQLVEEGLKAAGLKPMSIHRGKTPFDSNLHDAASHAREPRFPDGVIVDIVKHGFLTADSTMHHPQVHRRAVVVVNRV